MRYCMGHTEGRHYAMKTITVELSRYVRETATMDVEVPDDFEDYDSHPEVYDEILEKAGSDAKWDMD